jgi:ubiquinone biosynthesis monooxygenase Coq7
MAIHGRQSRALAGVDAELKQVVDKFREDEIGHKETSIEQGARDAFGYSVLSAVIKVGCRAAIRISEKI